MGRVHKARRLPEEARAWLEAAIQQDRYTLEELVAGLQERFDAELSRSSVHRWRQRIERTMQAIKASTEAARLIAQHAPDETDEHSAAVIRMVQSALFEALLRVREAEDVAPADQVRLLSQAARAIADASRASIGQKRWQDEARERLAALEAEEGNAGQRLDAATLQRVREALYGG